MRRTVVNLWVVLCKTRRLTLACCMRVPEQDPLPRRLCKHHVVFLSEGCTDILQSGYWGQHTHTHTLCGLVGDVVTRLSLCCCCFRPIRRATISRCGEPAWASSSWWFWPVGSGLWPAPTPAVCLCHSTSPPVRTPPSELTGTAQAIKGAFEPAGQLFINRERSYMYVGF